MEIARNQVELRDDPSFISPPWLEPVWQCGTAVMVHGFIPQATLDIEVAGAVVVAGFPGGFPMPNGARVLLPGPLMPGPSGPVQVRARQTFKGVTSDWSAPMLAIDHKTIFPAGLPRPRIDPAPVFRCGLRTGVANLLTGCKVWITADAAKVGAVDGAAPQQGVNVAPPYRSPRTVVAWASLCDDPSPPSEPKETQEPPLPLPELTPADVYPGGRQLTVTGVVNGALLTLARSSPGSVAASPISEPSWGGRHLIDVDQPFTEFEQLSVVQQMCPGTPPSHPGEIRVRLCADLRAPGVEPVQAGDTRVVLTEFVPDARIQVFVDGIKTGDGSGPVVQLRKPVAGNFVDVLQIVGSCVGLTLQRLNVQCVAPPLGYDPSALDLFPVGRTSYNAGPVTLSTGFTQPVAGIIYYPADADGVDKPFNGRCRQLGRLPIAVLVHGRHGSDDSHLGYQYLQHQLAGMGIVAVSVDCNASDDSPAGQAGGRNNILERAELITASIKYLQAIDRGSALFGGRLDFSRLALMGHSRGGEAVVLVTEIGKLPAEIGVKGVISLAPVNTGASSGSPGGYPFMTIVPACDGDVVHNNGIQFYDAATSNAFKAQLYVHHANHNFFNSRWLNDDAGGGLPIMGRAEHERILSTYGCAFFRAALLGHDTLAFLDGRLRPPGVMTDNVHLSFRRRDEITVDDHEQGNGIGLNSMGGATSGVGNLLASEHPFVQNSPTRFNTSFYGDTIGMVARMNGGIGEFASRLDRSRDLGGQEIWIRAAEVYDGSSVPSGATGFRLGLEDSHGVVAWVDADGVGGLPRPFDRRDFDLNTRGDDFTKTILKTLRFPIGCFKVGRFDSASVVAIRLQLNRSDERAIAFDDLQIVGP